MHKTVKVIVIIDFKREQKLINPYYHLKNVFDRWIIPRIIIITSLIEALSLLWYLEIHLKVEKTIKLS